MKEKIKTKIIDSVNNMLEKESSNANLVGAIAVFMIAISFIGNTNALNGQYLKSSLSENNKQNSFSQKSTNDFNLTIGKQTIKIAGVEYTIEITPKY